jgi:hypothetical protein
MGHSFITKGQEINMTSLAEAFPEEQARARRLLSEYQEIGAPGLFGAAVIEQALARADRAVMSGDVVEMIRAYEELKGLK